MKIEQIYTGCLAEAAYYIESNGEVAIVDPLRETQPYIDRAEKDGAQIKYVLETHFHADFVSGHLDLAKRTGAKIVFGPTAQPSYEAHVAEDGEVLTLGDIQIKVLHTPGHTMESTTFLVIDAEGKEHSIFTGDTLFIGDVGRPDLAVKTDLSREDLAGHLFDSLRTKIMTLPGDVIVYPGHGAGSACGKKMSDETVDTLAHQLETNYALRADMTRQEFIEEVTDGLVTPPQYFPKNAVLNKTGYESFEQVMDRGLQPLSVDDFLKSAELTDALILDTRTPDDFRDGHIPGSIFIGIDGSFATWVGTLITDLKQPMLIVADPGREEEVVTRLSRVGYDNALGYLGGGFEQWVASGREAQKVAQVSAAELKESINEPGTEVLDVRKKSEFDSQHIEGVRNLPLDFLNEHMNELDKDTLRYVHCAGGYRSMVFISILQARGYQHLVDVAGGFKAIEEEGFPMTEYVCPSTML
ncbi:MBL fold metallo-hydrolase [Cryomorphaceae bacterium]|nr:MBL fold metallo-hydrolase [Cryomorphaceae bacterium]